MSDNGLRQRKAATTQTKAMQVDDGRHIIDKDNKNVDNDVPFILRPWVYFQKALPPMIFFGLNFSVTIFSMLFFALVKYAGTQLLLVNGWPAGTYETTFNVACLVAMSHSTVILIPLYKCMQLQPFVPTRRLSDSPLYWQLSSDALLQYCTGYMIQDSVFTLIRAYKVGYDPSDTVFLAHHFVTVSYMTQCRYLKAGHISTMLCIFAGEVTNPVMMVWYITKNAVDSICCNGPRVAALFNASEFIYAFMYFVVRALIMPLLVVYQFYDIWFTKQPNIPTSVSIYWSLCMLIVVLGSYDYIVDCWSILMTYIKA